MKYNQLGVTDIKISHVSLGGASFCDIYCTHSEKKSIQFIRESFKQGINYVETGPWYGQGSSERTVGKALVGVPRNSYYIGSKVGRYEKTTAQMFDFSAEKTEFGVDNTLRLLGLDYVDLIQIHDFAFAPDISVILKETLPALQRAVDAGKARYIGLADYDIDLMKEVIEESEDVKISSILSYAKSTLYDNRLQNYTGFFKSKGVGVINAAATGMGLLTRQGPQDWHPADDQLRLICRNAVRYCEEQKVDLARIATWFTLQQPGIATNVCGFFSSEQVLDTIVLMDTGLSEHEHKVLLEVQEKFFSNTTMHWDGVEIQHYRNEMLRYNVPNK